MDVTVSASACALSPAKSAIAPAVEPAVHAHLVTRVASITTKYEWRVNCERSDGRKEKHCHEAGPHRLVDALTRRRLFRVRRPRLRYWLRDPRRLLRPPSGGSQLRLRHGHVPPARRDDR